MDFRLVGTALGGILLPWCYTTNRCNKISAKAEASLQHGVLAPPLFCSYILHDIGLSRRFSTLGHLMSSDCAAFPGEVLHCRIPTCSSALRFQGRFAQHPKTDCDKSRARVGFEAWGDRFCQERCMELNLPWALVEASQRRWISEKMNMGQEANGIW